MANSLGLEVRDDVLDVLRDLNMSSHGAAASQHFPAHSRTVDALHKVGFNDVNVDDAGCISCSEFQRCVLLLIEASSSSFASRRRHLSALIQELEGRMKVANPVESWNVLEAAVSAAIDYDELDAAISKAISKVSPKQLDKLAKLIEVWLRDSESYRSDPSFIMSTACLRHGIAQVVAWAHLFHNRQLGQDHYMYPVLARPSS